jgi:outer membrane protein assembly factor BamB
MPRFFVCALLLAATAAATLPAAARPIAPALLAPGSAAHGLRWSPQWEQPDTKAAAWMQPGYNAAHTGYNPREKTLGKTNVSNLTAGFSFTTGAAIDADIVESKNVTYVDSTDGNLYALSATTGAKLWSFAGTEGDWTQGVALSGNRLFVTCQIDAQHAGLCALNAKSGKLLWQWAIYDDPPGNPVGSAPYTGPVVSGDMVVLGESDTASFAHVGYFVALDAKTGAQLWVDGNCGNGGSNDCNGLGRNTPASDGTSVYYGAPVVISNVFFYDLCAVALPGGLPKWCSEVDDANPAVAVAGSVVYANAFVTADQAQIMYAFNAATGSLLWKHVFSDGGNQDLRPAIQGTTVYVAGGGNLYALDARSGTQKWEVPAGQVGGAVSAPSIANGVIYAECQGLCAYAASNGTLLWDSQPNVIHGSPSAPAVVDGRVYGVCSFNDACSFHT